MPLVVFLFVNDLYFYIVENEKNTVNLSLQSPSQNSVVFGCRCSIKMNTISTISLSH